MEAAGAGWRYGTQGAWAWKPSVVPGLGAVWFTGMTSGPLDYGAPGVPPTEILAPATASHVALALGPDGVHHLAYTTQQAGKSVVMYAVAAP